MNNKILAIKIVLSLTIGGLVYFISSASGSDLAVFYSSVVVSFCIALSLFAT